MKTETLEAVSAAANKSTLAGAGITGVGYLTASEIFGLIGVVIAVISAAVSWYYKRAAHRTRLRESAQRMEERALRMEMMKRRLLAPPLPPDEFSTDFDELGEP